MRAPLWRGWGEPFNGQQHRTRAVGELVERFAPDALIETGTHLGFTTRYLAKLGRPVYTVELDPGMQLLARRALREHSNVTLIRGDSSTALSWLAGEGEIERPLLYLDAHSPSGLPLDRELQAILGRWHDLVLLIDDFKVPHDSDYEHWTFRGEPLALEMLTLPDGVTAAFPGIPGSQETGSRKGAVYLGRGEGARAISDLTSAGLLAGAEETGD